MSGSALFLNRCAAVGGEILGKGNLDGRLAPS